MQPEVIIYSTPTCTYCAAAKRWFKEHGVSYVEHDVSRDAVRSAEMQRLTGQTAVPVIRVGAQVMVGFDPLQLARLIPANPTAADGGAAVPPAAGRVSLGMAAQSLTADKAAELGLPAAFGVVVGPVKPGGPAEAAGILEGDVLTGLGSYTLQDLAQLQRVVSLKEPGDSLALRLWRTGEEIEVTITFPAPEVAPTIPVTASGAPGPQ
ncbi:MAG: PDZ domain-containing protein, partial [Candidatus Dormibacteraeota bacterium]|nr:PDZ domain-containing protein [Candidatus Dormibacteraeota bacterium]